MRMVCFCMSYKKKFLWKEGQILLSLFFVASWVLEDIVAIIVLLLQLGRRKVLL
jgi:hypothetical protein